MASTTELTPQQLWEHLFEKETSVSWTRFRDEIKHKLYINGGVLRGFKRWIADKDGNSYKMQRDKFLSAFTHFPKIILTSYRGGNNLTKGIPNIYFVLSCFSFQSFVDTTEPQERFLKNSEYCVRWTRGQYVFCIECKDASGKYSKYAVSINGDKLHLSESDAALNLEELIKNFKEFKNLKPRETIQLYIDKQEEELLIYLKNTLKPPANPIEEYKIAISQGIETVEQLLNDK